ncbi:MAG: preQ(1) synthase [Bdellovibrionota bacterium]
MAEAEGRKLPFVGPEHVDTKVLESFPYEGPKQNVVYTTKEFSAVCPFSGLPDISTVEVEYIPNKSCVELKSLKYYFMSYRNVGIYQEAVTAKLYQDLYKVLEPHFLRIKTYYNTRGGIDAVCEVRSDKQ